MTFDTLVYRTDGAIATITLNRPDELNTIVPPMPEEFESAINVAVKDPSIKVIILRGAGRSFCAGYDFGGGFHLWDEHITTNGAWDSGKDFAWSTAYALGADAEIHEHVARTQACHRPGSRLVRRRRQRYRALRRHRHRQRGCADRNTLFADVGMLSERHVALSARTDQS